MTDYPEIELLNLFKKQHDISVTLIEAEKIDPKLFSIEFNIKQNKFIIQSDDEYHDLKVDSEILHLIIALREVETIEASTDFLDWCRQLNLNASNEKLLTYYKEISSQLFNFKNLFENGILNSFISDLDYQLNAGAIQILRLNKLK